MAFHFFLFLPKKELRHAEGSEPGAVRRKLILGWVPEVTVRSMFISQVSWRGRHRGAERLAELLTAGLELGTPENGFTFQTDWPGAEQKSIWKATTVTETETQTI